MKCYKNWQTKWKKWNWIFFFGYTLDSGILLFDTARGFDMMFYAIFITFVLNSTAFGWVVQLQNAFLMFLCLKKTKKKHSPCLRDKFCFATQFDHLWWYLSDGSPRTDFAVLERPDLSCAVSPMCDSPPFCPVCPACLCWMDSLRKV